MVDDVVHLQIHNVIVPTLWRARHLGVMVKNKHSPTSSSAMLATLSELLTNAKHLIANGVRAANHTRREIITTKVVSKRKQDSAHKNFQIVGTQAIVCQKSAAQETVAIGC